MTPKEEVLASKEYLKKIIKDFEQADGNPLSGFPGGAEGFEAEIVSGLDKMEKEIEEANRTGPMLPEEAVNIWESMFHDFQDVWYRGKLYNRQMLGSEEALRAFDIPVEVNGKQFIVRCIEQNMDKNSPPAKRARDGAKIMWLIATARCTPSGTWRRVEDGRYYKGNNTVPTYIPPIEREE